MKFKIEGRHAVSIAWDTITHGDAKEDTVSAQFIMIVQNRKEYVEFRLTVEPDTSMNDCAAGDHL